MPGRNGNGKMVSKGVGQPKRRLPSGRAGAVAPASRQRHQPKAVQPIRDGETYPLEIIPEVLGISVEAIRNARQQGLQVVPLGTKLYVAGEELRRFLHGSGSFAARSGDRVAKVKS